MASLAELVRANTAFDPDELGHLQRLVRSWGLLADFCFADLMLVVPIGALESFLVIGQVRPTTGQTLYRDDMVGVEVRRAERQIFARTFELGEILEGDAPPLTPPGEGDEPVREDRVRVECIPVRWGRKTLAVVCREAPTLTGRRPGELERIYLEIFDRLAVMITRGQFPFEDEGLEPEEAPRVGDGVIVLDWEARVRYASPNAVSVLHRMDIHANTQGLSLADVGFEEAAVRNAWASRGPVLEEIERGNTSVVVRVIPVIDDEGVGGAVVLLRDVSELRRRDRMLLSKDATIREIHHRVKNNLQTIASLLRLQARRLSSGEAKSALEESVRRIRSIAVVHETLAREAGDVVALDEIVKPIVRMVGEGLAAAGRSVVFDVQGDAGELPAEIVTPLAVVLNELLQNVSDHAFPEELGAEGRVVIRLSRDGDDILVDVEDDGVGFPPGFSAEASTGLGLSIVHALVTTELGGSISFSGEGGASTHIRVPSSPVPRVER